MAPADGSKAVRTDSYGAYVWDTPTDRWFPFCRQRSAGNRQQWVKGDGVDEIVFDPQNSNAMWMQWDGFMWSPLTRENVLQGSEFSNQSYPRQNNSDVRTQRPVYGG
jgi:hypothetical protein